MQVQVLYNNLPHILEAKDAPMPRTGLLLDLIKKYNLGNVIGVVRLHKHFEILSDQFVVWTTKPIIRSQVRKTKGSPMCFACIDGDWKETQYYEGPDVWSQLQMNQEFKKFLEQFKEMIKGYEKVYGLILRLNCQGNDIEQTDTLARTQKITPKQNTTKQHQCEVLTKFWADGPIGECYNHSSCIHTYCSTGPIGPDPGPDS